MVPNRANMPVTTRSVPTRAVATAACLAVVVCGGCGLPQWARQGFKVGPEYCRPPAPVASDWIDSNDDRLSTDPPRLADWWNTFNDPVLDRLIQTAHLQNLSLREAGARILEARYRRRFAAGNVFPQLQEAAGSYSRNKVSSNLAFVPPQLWFSEWDAGFNLSWEIDFWGRYRRAVEAADADLDASIENYDDVLVLLLAEVAAAYTELRTFQQRLVYAHDNVRAQEQALRIAEDKLRAGASTERDVQQARTVLEQTRALIPTFEAGERLANNRLCVLLGVPPVDLAEQLGSAPIPSAPAEVAIGIPADLVRRRPDVRRAERELAAQSARIGIAEADFYPHISLNGSIGVAAQDFNNLFDGSRSMIGGVGPSFRWDLLNYGRIASNVGIQDARFQQLAWAYQQRILQAGREAEDAIVAYLRNQQRVRNLTASAAAAQRTLEITSEQYRQGVVDFTAVFIASSELAARQDQMADAQGVQALSLIELYRALGGGWEIRLAPPIDLQPLPPEPGALPDAIEPPSAEPIPSAPGV